MKLFCKIISLDNLKKIMNVEKRKDINFYSYYSKIEKSDCELLINFLL